MTMESKKYLQLNDIEAHKLSFHLSNHVYNIVVNWEFFQKSTVGNQFVRVVDSISANIAEGFGRFNKKDKIKFYRISYGSLMESLDWNEKARVRQLLMQEQYQYIFAELSKMPLAINSLIKFTNDRLIE